MTRKRSPRASSPSSTRPPETRDLPGFLTLKGKELYLTLKVRPGASISGWDGVLGDRLKVRVTGPAHEGKANKSLIDFIAKALRCPRRDIAIVAGEKSREKTLRLTGRALERALNILSSI